MNSPAFAAHFSRPQAFRLDLQIYFKNPIPSLCDLDTNMDLKMGPGNLQDIQRALLVACLSLFALFLVKLFNARMRFIKMQKQGLVRNAP